ncbi:hypothetical protein LXL04_003301 [Taraxacum kok-saghyz]
MSDKEIARNLFSVGPPSGSRQSSDRSGRSLSAGRSPPRNTLTSGSVPRGGVPGRSPSLSGGGGHPRNSLTGGSPQNHFLGTSTPRGRVSPDLPSVPFPGGSRTSPPSFTGGYSGSSSMDAINPNSGEVDPLADMAGILRNMGIVVTPYNYWGNREEHYQGNHEEHNHGFSYDEVNHEHSPIQAPHHSDTHANDSVTNGDSNAPDSHGCNRPFIKRRWYKFARHKIHRGILKIFWQSLNKPWITFKKIPPEVVSHMYERFRTLYRWDPNEEERIREGFENTLKDCYRDRIKDARKASAKKARKSGHVILVLEIRDSFEILENHTPGVIPSAVWKQLCRKWNTDEWKKKSKAARENRNKTDSSGCTARHTGGSIRYEEHRLKLKELTGEDPPYMDVFFKVNLTSESKKKYFEGDKEVPLDFATGTAREAAEAYNRGLFEKYGEDPAQHMVNDPELWTQTQLRRQGGKQKGPMFGIGSSDLNYLVTGTYSSQSSSSSVAAADYAKSQADYAKSQEKVIEFEQQLVNMQQSMDESQNAMNSEMEQMKKMREDMAAFMREFRPPGNPPQ